MKLCMFDLDGTLADTLVTIAHYVNITFKDYGFEEIPVEDFKQLVGAGSKVLIQRALKWHGANPDEFEIIHTDYRKRYDADFMYLTTPYEGIIEMLKRLKENGTQIAVISNKDDRTTKNVVEKLFGDKLIDLCIGARKDVPLKPAPDALLEVIKHFNADKKNCFYIGDTGTDMETAKNAGVFAIGVLWGFRDKAELTSSGADTIAAKPSEIIKIIEGCF
ncbi:MAG: HAD family hydrolase [Clostridia bacterium]|nr:HAD family hydrolase [Clostridia bacterium]